MKDMTQQEKGAPPLDKVMRVMRQAHGKELSMFDEVFLAKAVDTRRMGAPAETWTDYLDRLAHDGGEAEALLQSLSITFSEFFRNPLTFALLEQLILPSLVAVKDATAPAEIRIWSAGCAAGQEAYSVAILLEALAGARGHAIPYRIFATDISDTALAMARAGAYDAAAVGNVPLKHIRRSFAVRGESYEITPALKARVAFSAYDLLDEDSVCPPASLYGDFDLILCCNVLFYYRSDIRRRILDKVCRGLSPGGYLVTGEAGRDIAARQTRLRALSPPAPIFRKKGKP
jgi:chemotaxis protein methyltransferase CheR